MNLHAPGKGSKLCYQSLWHENITWLNNEHACIYLPENVLTPDLLH